MTPRGPEPAPVGRIRFMDRQRVNLDGFAIEDPELGLTALRSPYDPEPGLVVSGGRVTDLDGVPEAVPGDVGVDRVELGLGHPVQLRHPAAGDDQARFGVVR